MRIKTKLNLGVGLLFLLIIILSLFSIFSIYSIKKDTQNILKANYETLEYSRNMLSALAEIDTNSTKVISVFETNLKNQIRNITENGENELTFKLQENFNILKKNQTNDSIKFQIHKNLFEIMKLNMNAIKTKSEIARKTSETSNFWVILIGTFCFLIAFNLLINLPSNIANPIKELTLSIQEIANKNYSERVHFLNHNEFGDLARSFNTMASKLEEYHSSNLYKLAFEKKRLETLINNMHDPIIGLDDQEIIIFINDEALKISGLKKENVVGESAFKLALENDLIRSLLSNKSEEKKKTPIKIFADGKESYFEKELVNITVIPTGETKTLDIGNVIILRNITIFKELDFAKTNFIATVSHELKTPIASIKLSLQILENEKTGKINEDQKQLIESIKEDSQRLLKITGELLDITQLETGKIHLKIEKCEPSKIVEDAIEAVIVQAEQKNIEIFTKIEGNLPSIFADKEKMGWVVINFLTNAIKYSPNDSSIEVRLKKFNDKLLLQVIDQGKGIDDRYQKKVFDKYFQIPGSDKSGTGLGLAICKEFIEAQNGSISVESKLGLGSIFSIKMNI